MIPNSYLKEIRLFIKNFTEWILLLLIFTTFFFSFGIREIIIFGKALYFPFPQNPSFATEIFNFITSDLIPESVTLIVTNPLTAFIVQVKIALLLSFVVTLPFLLYRLIKYFSPALYVKEKISIIKVVVPSAILFILGTIFSYFVLIPPTFSILYSYTEGINASPFFTVNEFIGLVVSLLFATGLMFLLPVCMILLTRFGIVSPHIWQEQWRYALLFFLIVSAIITPDGSGVTMLLLSVPMVGLYGIGYIFSKKVSLDSRKIGIRNS